MILHAIYLRLDREQLEALRRDPSGLASLRVNDALAEGRALDLGRAWEELGCLLEGGIRSPDTGPTVGFEPLGSSEEGLAWAGVDPDRVRAVAADLEAIDRPAFIRLYATDDETADGLPGDRTGEWGDRGEYLFGKLELLRRHYTDAARHGQAVLVRIAPRPRP